MVAVGELMAGCIGGALSAWNTPFEVARIEATARIFNSGNSGGPAIPRPGGADADVYEEEIFVAKATSIIKSHSDNGGGGGDGSSSAFELAQRVIWGA